MLDIANKYEKELQELFMNTWHNEKYMFHNCSTCYDKYKAMDSTWNANEFVSKDSKGNIIGYISYDVNRITENADGLNIINFSNNKIVFGKDVIKVLAGIFEKYHFKKISFFVVVGNPIEKSYDKLINKYGGRIVGTQRKHCKLIDGNYYDLKLYEIFREDYLERKNKNGND